jgi:NAD dependent epimerase/dehydratase
LEEFLVMSTGAYPGRLVLVTGAGGFIGSHLVEALVKEGARVRAMLRYSSRADAGNLEYLPGPVRAEVEIIRGDIRDPHFMLDACNGVEVVFHLAALIGIPYSYEAPGEYVATNVTGTLNVLEAARRRGAARIVHTSTSETYGTAQYRPIDERHPSAAQSPYAATKVGADKLAESYHHSFGVPVVTVRPFNTFGPRQSARAVIPTILAQLLAGREQLRLGSLEPERDLTYVSDTVAGMLELGNCDAAVGRGVNLGTGSSLSIGELAKRCMAVVGRHVPIEVEVGRVRPADSEVMALISDNRQARELCGWRPVVSIDEGLQRCADFIRRYPELYHPEEYQR